jgi:hypothetical protein
VRFFVSGNFHGNLVVWGEKYGAAGEKKSGLYAEISYYRAPAFLIRIAICAPLYFNRRGALTSVVHGVSAAKARGRQGTWVCKYSHTVSLSRSLALVWLLAGAAHNLECMQASHTWVLVRREVESWLLHSHPAWYSARSWAPYAASSSSVSGSRP